MKTASIPYQDKDTELEAFVAYPEKKKCPVVILCHAWAGRDAFICEKAKNIAQLGYVGFALDMYGKNTLGKSKEECIALKSPFIQDRYLLHDRVTKAFEVACYLPDVNTNKVAILGFGFGGICALDLARSGANLKGVISIYGHFDPPPLPLIKEIQAKILVLHGYDDKISPLSELEDFEQEMNKQKVDWQAHIYGGTMHSFATPSANDIDSNILYNLIAAKRAWITIENFLQEIFV